MDIDEWDVRYPCPSAVPRTYDYVVANHLLSQLDHHDVKKALVNIRSVIKPGGTLRVMDIAVEPGLTALLDEDEDWFPQDDRTGGLDAKFCTWLTWFGTRKSVFTAFYMRELLEEAGFSEVRAVRFRQTWTPAPDVVDLDDREHESLFFEAVA
jgi:hypothetical protein